MPVFPSSVAGTNIHHSEHLKRAHSLLYVCSDCNTHLHSITSKLDLKALKKDHRSKCGKEESRKTSEVLRMTQEQHVRWMKWNKEDVESTPKERKPPKSWRKIYKSLYPEEAAQGYPAMCHGGETAADSGDATADGCVDMVLDEEETYNVNDHHDNQSVYRDVTALAEGSPETTPQNNDLTNDMDFMGQSYRYYPDMMAATAGHPPYNNMNPEDVDQFTHRHSHQRTLMNLHEPPYMSPSSGSHGVPSLVTGSTGTSMPLDQQPPYYRPAATSTHGESVGGWPMPISELDDDQVFLMGVTADRVLLGVGSGMEKEQVHRGSNDNDDNGNGTNGDIEPSFLHLMQDNRHSYGVNARRFHFNQ